MFKKLIALDNENLKSAKRGKKKPSVTPLPPLSEINLMINSSSRISDDLDDSYDSDDSVIDDTEGSQFDNLFLEDDISWIGETVAFAAWFGCIVHQLQLVGKFIEKAVDGYPKGKFNEYFRAIKKFIRKTKTFNLYNKYAKGLPLLPTPTDVRFSSNFNPIKILLRHQEEFKKMAADGVGLTNDCWCFMAEYAEAFEPIYKATRALQSAAMTLRKI
jgi:hypothetical protein